MATTTNFGWTTPNDTDLVKDGAAAIRTALNGVDTSFVDLKGGTTGQVLSKNSGTDMDFTWVADASGIPATILDAKGDIIAATAADTAARLAVGANGTILTADSTETTGLKWVTPAGGGKVLQVVYVQTTTDITIATATPTDTGLSATITPSSATSQILVLTTHMHELKTTTSNISLYAGLRLLRGANSLQTSTADSGVGMKLGSSAAYELKTSMVMNYLDSPATTSATTYKTQSFTDQTIRFGFDGAWSSMVLMEIGA
jgi:hypothetical protein